MGSPSPHSASKVETDSMKVLWISLILSVIAGTLAEEDAVATEPPQCPDFNCPNNDQEGGLFAAGHCAGEFCECSFGYPYLQHCDEGLIFNEVGGYCDWCFNMCDQCADSCSECP